VIALGLKGGCQLYIATYHELVLSEIHMN